MKKINVFLGVRIGKLFLIVLFFFERGFKNVNIGKSMRGVVDYIFDNA